MGLFLISTVYKRGARLCDYTSAGGYSSFSIEERLDSEVRQEVHRYFEQGKIQIGLFDAVKVMVIWVHQTRAPIMRCNPAAKDGRVGDVESI
jgi:hypothetical protein